MLNFKYRITVERLNDDGKYEQELGIALDELPDDFYSLMGKAIESNKKQQVPAPPHPSIEAQPIRKGEDYER